MLKKFIALSVSLFSIFTASCSDQTQDLSSLNLNQEVSQQKFVNSEYTSQSIEVPVKPSSTNPYGISTMNFSKVNNNLYRGGLPNAENVGKLKKMGIKTVISLQGACYPEICNGASEDNDVATEKKNLQDVKIKFVNIPLPLTKEIPNSMIKKFLDTVENKSNQPVYLHCYHGRDRTGTMISLYKIKHQGISGKDAIEEMKTFGFKPENFPFFNKLVLESTPSASYLK